MRACICVVVPRHVASCHAVQFHPGDVVRFELDMDAGVCKAFVNGADQGVVFTDLSGLEVFPAVCFYSSGRAASLVKLECATSAGAKYLCDLTENTSASRVHGILGKKRLVAGAEHCAARVAGHLFAMLLCVLCAGPGSAVMCVNGQQTEYGVCTAVPSNGTAGVVYDLEADAVCLPRLSAVGGCVAFIDAVVLAAELGLL